MRRVEMTTTVSRRNIGDLREQCTPLRLTEALYLNDLASFPTE
jgi:hypothetical protein